MADLVEGFVSLLVPNAGALNLGKFAKKGDIKSAQKVMQKNNVTCEAKNEEGLPPLHIAIINDQLKFAEWLLNDCKAEIDSTENENLYTALHLCIKKEKWDNAIWLIERGADWEAQAQLAGETPMQLVENSGNNRFLHKFKDACNDMKGKRVKDKREASRPKAVATQKFVSAAETAAAPAASSSSSTSSGASSSGATRASSATNASDSFVADTVAIVKAIKQFKALCDNGDADAAEAEAQNIDERWASYKNALANKVAAVPAEGKAKADESQAVLMKGVSAYLTVGRAALNNPNDATQNKLNQVSQLLDKHFKRLTEIVIKKNYNVA